MHLEAAKSLGDYLVVSITAAHFITKPGRPIFTDGERATMLRALRCVDEVFVCNDDTGVQAIMRIRPQRFVKGRDYMDLGLLDAEAAACNVVGAKVIYTDTKKYSSTEVLCRLKG